MNGNTEIIGRLDVIVPDPSLPRDTPANEIIRLPQYLRLSFKGSPGLTFVVLGEDEPTGANANLPWIKLDSQSRPVGLFVKYSGNYVKVYDLGINVIQGYQGDSLYPQPPFYFCDGTNGTPDLRPSMIASDGTTNHPDTQASYNLAYMQYKGYR